MAPAKQPYRKPEVRSTATDTRARWKEYSLWLLSDETGMSSLTLFRAGVGLRPSPGEDMSPADVHDFARCMRLVERFPEVKRGLVKLARTDSRWRTVKENWVELQEYALEGDYHGADKILGRAR